MPGGRSSDLFAGLPPTTTVVEVGPRDGLQSLDHWVETDDKVRAIDRLSAAGFRVIEVGSFSHPEAVPHLRDTEEVLARIERHPGTTYRALVPNERGAQRAVEAGVDVAAGLVTVSEAYTRRNQRMSVDQAIEQLARAHAVATAAGLGFTAGIGMAFFGPDEGRIPEEQTLDMIARVHALGVRSGYLSGSLGLEDPRHVASVFGAAAAEWPELELGYHVHDLAGFGAANVLAALAGGAAWVEGSICGIGGGTAMPDGMPEVGNMATEDLVHLLDSVGISCALDPATVLEAARDVAEVYGVEPRSHVHVSGVRATVRRT
jgi:hydroxymethylglutaryl-CoA lyase